FGKSSLAATRTAKQCNVLDFVCLIYSHNHDRFKKAVSKRSTRRQQSTIDFGFRSPPLGC
ncbi:hypothetical protein, partial [Prevotella nigrescens]|uniref:hypothetical protein n=1 Tax=Prevotella nigrescens TaxID=28133 RepID=UPI00241E3FC3